MYLVITEIFSDSGIEYWFYDAYADEDTACEVALELGNDYTRRVFHSVIPADYAVDWDVKNVPSYLL